MRNRDSGSLIGAKLALAAGANANARDEDKVAPLHWAAYEGRKEIVRLLLDRGADVTVKDIKGLTPLDCASVAPRHQSDVIQMLEAAAKQQKSHADRIAEERKDKGPPQVGG